MKNVEKVMQDVAKSITQRILGGRGINGDFLSGMTAGLQSAGYPELSDALMDWESAPPEELSKLINRWAGERVFKSDLTLENPARRPKESPLYVKYLSLMSGEEPFMMQGTKYEYVWAEYPGGIKDIGVYSYAGDLVYSYDSFRKMMNLDRTSPVHSRNPRQRIGISLSKSRRRNPLESGATISDDEDINDRASNMG
jgi:hypothetical protein